MHSARPPHSGHVTCSVEEMSWILQLSQPPVSESSSRAFPPATPSSGGAYKDTTEPGAPFSCFVNGPTVAIQLDAVEDTPGTGANHLHSLWRDPERDFGADLLARHYAEAHGEDR